MVGSCFSALRPWARARHAGVLPETSQQVRTSDGAVPPPSLSLLDLSWLFLLVYVFNVNFRISLSSSRKKEMPLGVFIWIMLGL